MGIVCSANNTPTVIQPRNSMEVYYSPQSPPSRAVLLTLSALELKPELRALDLFQKAEHKQAWFLKINPMHSVPVIDDNGFILSESRAILCYLVNKYGKTDSLYPQDPLERAMVDRMLYFDMGTVYKSITDFWYAQVLSNEPPDSQKENVLKQSLEYLDGFLSKGSKYAAGDHVTIADFSLLASVTTLEVFDYSYNSYEHVKMWSDALKGELPYYKTCVQDGLDMTKAWIKSLREK